MGITIQQYKLAIGGFSMSTFKFGGPRKIEFANLEPSRYLQNINDNTKFLYMLYFIIIIYLYNYRSNAD